MDSLLTGIGPYTFGATGLGMNDMSMYPMLNYYQNQVGVLDNYNSMMTMDGSLFPSFTGSYNFDYDQFYSTMQQNQDRIMENSLHQAEKLRENSFKSTAPINKVQQTAERLHEKVVANEQEQIKQALRAFVASIKSAYDPDGTASSDDIMAQAEYDYKRCTGRSLQEDLRECGDGSFKQGFLQTLSLGLYDGVTVEENISEITGQPVGRKNQALKDLGHTAGGATLGAVLGGVLGKVKSWKLSGKLAVLGVIAGSIAGYLGGNGVSQVHEAS